MAVFYLIMDTLIDSFFPVLSDFDDAIDQLETAILKTPTEEQLGTLFDMKRQIMTIRKVIAPQRDMIASLNGGLVEIPGMTDKGTAYFRNLYDHLIRISDMVDAYRDLISSAMDTHLSMVSNRLNVVMKQLAIIATIFLPLGFLTGFFGQNFAWPITHIHEPDRAAGICLGLGSELVAIVSCSSCSGGGAGWAAGPPPEAVGPGRVGGSHAREPTRGTATRGRVHGGGVEAGPGEQPGSHRVGVPHFSQVQFIAAPGRGRDLRHVVEEGMGGPGVAAEVDRAVHGEGQIGDDTVAPTADLVAEDAEVPGPWGSDRAVGDDAPVRGLVAGGDRGHLDRERTIAGDRHQRGVVQVVRVASLHERRDATRRPVR